LWCFTSSWNQIGANLRMVSNVRDFDVRDSDVRDSDVRDY
jgi:hypothetical protein